METVRKTEEWTQEKIERNRDIVYAQRDEANQRYEAIKILLKKRANNNTFNYSCIF